MKKIFHFNARYLAWTAVFSALASVLQLLEFGLPILPSFLKVDFSELPALLAAFSLGPSSGILVCLIKNLIKLATTFTAGVGEFANFLIGVTFVLPAGLIYKYKRTFAGAVTGSLVGMVCCSLLSVPVNLYITYPVYFNIMPYEVIMGMYQAILPSADTLVKALFIFNVPLTAGKALINAVITFLVYKRLSYFIKNGIKVRRKKAAELPGQTSNEQTTSSDHANTNNQESPGNADMTGNDVQINNQQEENKL